jgi:hypothetical protein
MDPTMGVRPPSDDIDAEPDVVEFGIAALDARMESEAVSFPATAAELSDQWGHVEIPYDAAGHSVRLGTALTEADREEFETKQDLLNALHPVFERKREATSTSLLAQLRALVPF